MAPGDEARARAALVAALRGLAVDRRAADAFARRGKHCPIQRPMRDRW